MRRWIADASAYKNKRDWEWVKSLQEKQYSSLLIPWIIMYCMHVLLISKPARWKSPAPYCDMIRSTLWHMCTYSLSYWMMEQLSVHAWFDACRNLNVWWWLPVSVTDSVWSWLCNVSGVADCNVQHQLIIVRALHQSTPQTESWVLEGALWTPNRTSQASWSLKRVFWIHQ